MTGDDLLEAVMCGVFACAAANAWSTVLALLEAVR
jgi:hypothetical protein